MKEINNLFFKNEILIYLLPISMIIGQAALSINVALLSIILIFKFFYGDLKFKYYKGFFISFLAWCIVLIISATINLSNYDNDYSLVFSILFLRNLLLIYCFIYFLNNFNKIKIFSLVVLSCIIFVSLDNYYQFFFTYDIFGIPKETHRLTGPFGENEYISGSYIYKFFIISYFYLYFANKQNIFFKILFILLIYFSVLLSGERSAIILLSVIIIFLLISEEYFSKKKKVFVFLSLIFTIIIFLNFSNSFRERVNDTIKDLTIYEKNRYLAHFYTGYEIGKKNLLFGIGPKNFLQECEKDHYDFINAKEIRCTTHPHNKYIQLFAESGILGLICFFVIFLFIIIYFYRYKHSKFKILKNYKNIIFFSTIIIVFWPFTTTGSIFSNFNSSFLWINLGFYLSVLNVYEFKN